MQELFKLTQTRERRGIIALDGRRDQELFLVVELKDVNACYATYVPESDVIPQLTKKLHVLHALLNNC